MCMFSSPKMPPPPAMPEVEDPNEVDGAGVAEGYADTLTEKQKRFRAGQPEEETESLLT